MLDKIARLQQTVVVGQSTNGEDVSAPVSE